MAPLAKRGGGEISTGRVHGIADGLLYLLSITLLPSRWPSKAGCHSITVEFVMLFPKYEGYIFRIRKMSFRIFFKGLKVCMHSQN